MRKWERQDNSTNDGDIAKILMTDTATYKTYQIWREGKKKVMFVCYTQVDYPPTYFRSRIGTICSNDGDMVKLLRQYCHIQAASVLEKERKKKVRLSFIHKSIIHQPILGQEWARYVLIMMEIW